MALKLGELLLKEKMVTPGQLEEALKNQVVYGIRLGRRLAELQKLVRKASLAFEMLIIKNKILMT